MLGLCEKIIVVWLKDKESTKPLYPFKIFYFYFCFTWGATCTGWLENGYSINKYLNPGH